MDSALKDILVNSSDLPSLPSVALKILNLIEQDNFEPAELIATFNLDMATVSRILKAANSPVYGFIEQVKSIEHAVALLGMKKTQLLALSFSLTSMIKQRYPASLDFQHFWMRSIIAATATKSLITKGDDAEALFLAALLQDIGIFILTKCLGETYLSAISNSQYVHPALVIQEEGLLNTNHSEVGAWVLSKWHFPEEIVLAVRNSHHTNINMTRFSTIIALSGWVADIWLAKPEDQEEKSEATIKLIMEKLNFSYEQARKKIIEVSETLPEIAMWFNDHKLIALNEEKQMRIMAHASSLLDFIDQKTVG